MDERAEIWIARDPDTNAQSKPVSLRKLRKGVQIGRLKPSTLVQRVGASEWVSLERLLADAETLSQTPGAPPARTGTLRPPAVSAVPPPPNAVASPAARVPRPETPAPADLSSDLPKVVVQRSERPPPPAVAPSAGAPEAATPAAAAPAPAPRMPSGTEEVAADAIEEISSMPLPEAAPASQEAWTPPPAPAGPDDSSVTAQWFADSLPPEPGDDEPIFLEKHSVLDLGFERVMATKLVKLTYVLMLGLLSVAVLASVVHVVATVATGDGAAVATALAMVPVVILASAIFAALVRMSLEVLLALFRIADGMTFVTAAMHRQLVARRR